MKISNQKSLEIVKPWSVFVQIITCGSVQHLRINESLCCSKASFMMKLLIASGGIPRRRSAVNVNSLGSSQSLKNS